MSTGPLLEVDDLSISYGSRLLVNGVSFALDNGESLALVGESGSGKSLTARAIADLLPSGVATGRVFIEGAPVRRSRRRSGDALPRIGLLMQDPFTMLNPTMTAGGHIAETLRAAGRPRADIPAEVSRRLEEVGITDASVARRYPFELSGECRSASLSQPHSPTTRRSFSLMSRRPRSMPPRSTRCSSCCGGSSETAAWALSSSRMICASPSIYAIA